jgi:hypothetical protein
MISGTTSLQRKHHHRLTGLFGERFQPSDVANTSVDQQAPQALHGLDGQERIAADKPKAAVKREFSDGLSDEERVCLLLDLVALVRAKPTIQLIFDLSIERTAERGIARDEVEPSKRRLATKIVTKHKVMRPRQRPPASGDIRQRSFVETFIDLDAPHTL